MLDNFGLGEFFFLAMLALLFFGPERLPQIGARLGRWVAGLTQYSKAFLTEWREEALAIHEAVEEVKGIRDEIVAAQQELSSTLDTARDDLVEGVDTAKDAISGASRDVAQRIQDQQQEAASDLDRMAREERGEVEPDGSGEQEAIEKTQQILASLRARQEDAGDGAGGEAEDDTSPAADDTGGEAEDEWERNRRAIQEIMDRSKASATAQPASDKPSEGQGEAEPAAAGPVTEDTVRQADATTETGAEPDAEPEKPKETAFDRTQRILEELKRKRSSEAVEEPAPVAQADSSQVEEQKVKEVEEPEKEASSPRATAFDRTQEILQDLMAQRSGAKEAKAITAVKAKAAASPTEQPAETVLVPEVDPSAFAQLSAQVTQLQDEMEALRKELQALRSAAAELSIEEAA
jgi:Sec-independent protein translocase protein TatA